MLLIIEKTKALKDWTELVFNPSCRNIGHTEDLLKEI